MLPLIDDQHPHPQCWSALIIRIRRRFHAIIYSASIQKQIWILNSDTPRKLQTWKFENEPENKKWTFTQEHSQAAEGRGDPRNRKNCCGKWCHKRFLKMDRKLIIEINFPLRFSDGYLKIFSGNFNIHWFLDKTRKNKTLDFLISFF